MASAVYLLCALTSLACAVLLFRGYRRQRADLLLWAGLCFSCFAIGNALLVADLVMVPQRELPMLRSVPVLVGLALLLYGLVWESR